MIIRSHPVVNIELQLFNARVELAPERAGVKLVLNRLMETLADAVGLRALGFGSRMIDTF